MGVWRGSRAVKHLRHEMREAKRRRRVSQGHCREYFTLYYQHVRSSHCYITRSAISCYLGDMPYGVMGGEHITLTWVGSVGLKYWLICDHISMADFSPAFLFQMEELSALTPILSSHNSGKLVSSRLKSDIWIDKTSQIASRLFIFYCTISCHYKHNIDLEVCLCYLVKI